MDVVTIKISKPRKGWAYHGGEVVNLPSDTAKEFIDEGFAIAVPDTDGEENPLHEDMPGREILFAEGLESIKEILLVQDTLIDIKGVGQAIAANIVAFCEEHEE